MDRTAVPAARESASIAGDGPVASSALVAACKVLVAIRSVATALFAWLDVAMRVWLAQAFLVGAVVTLMRDAPPMMSGAGLHVDILNRLVASPFGILTQTVCPILLLLGFFSRFAAVPLLVQVLLLRVPGGHPITHLAWSVLLGWTIVIGPGPYSLDALFGRGLDSSAIPGTRTVGIVFAWITRRLGPWYWLMMRLWVASVPLAQAATAYGLDDTMRSGPLSTWLAAVPDGTGMLPPGLSLLIGLLLLLGLGTRGCALILMIAIPIGQAGMATDDRLFWAVLLGILACRGSGPFALDTFVARAVDAVDRRRLTVDPSLPHVVILGGGFGGVSAARGLRNAPCRVTVVDRNNHHVFQPLLYQVATAGLSPAAIATPIRSLFRSQTNLQVLLAQVRGVSAATAEVLLDQGRLAFDYLVVATGARHSYFGRDDWADDAPGLKRIEDATEIRRRLLIGFERAESAVDPSERARWMTFIIVGGGPTGVELAGAIAELARHGLQQDYRRIDPADARVVLVQSADRLLPTFPPSLSADARAELRKLNVEILTGAKVEEIDGGGVVVGGEKIEARTVLWAAGVTASPAAHWLGSSSDKAGRVVVGPDLSVTPHANIFVIGDTAASTGWKGQAVPGLAPAAKQGGAYVAGVIRSRLTHRPVPAPFRYRHPGSLATIGRRAAVAEFGPLKIHGALAWWIWGAVHILFLAGGRNRAAVMLEWGWAYITYRRGSRLITEPRSTEPLGAEVEPEKG